MNEVPSALLARGLIRAFVAGGVDDVVYCPGSRDAPFGYALDAAERVGSLRVHVRLDERAAGFMALGIAKASSLVGRPRPVVVITTSGTAVANLHPALCEADAAGVPVVACSADRPHEMWGTGANQTTHQLGLFGPIMRRVEDIPADFPVDERLDGLVGRALSGCTGALSADPGPVQLNVCFRDPLVPNQPWRPDRSDEPLTDSAGTTTGSGDSGWSPGAGSQPVTMPGRSVVVAGDDAGPDAEQVAVTGGWPLLAEPSSGARFGPNALVDYQAALGGSLTEQVEGVLVYGHPTLSRPVSALLARRGVRIVVVTRTARWTDVSGMALVRRAPVNPVGHAPHGWLTAWQDAGLRSPQLPDAKARACASVWRAHCTPDAPALVIGASEPIRAFDRCAGPEARPPLVIANRGLGGIDGTTSTATGVWAALHRPVRVVVGDLTAAHDGLGLLRGVDEPEPDVQVVVLADAGGAIFAGLEHAAAEPALFHRYFLTPQQLDLASLARSVGATHRRVQVGNELDDALREPIHGRSYLEVPLPALG